MPALNAKKMILAPWCETVESEEEIKKVTKELSEKEAVEQAKQHAEQQKVKAEKSKKAEESSKDNLPEDSGEEFAPALSGAMKTLCMPLEQPEMPPGTKCFFTGQPARRWCLWGRSY